MKKIIFGVIITFLLSLSTLAFNDLDNIINSERTHIIGMQYDEILEGYSDGTFRKNEFINTAEFLKIILKQNENNHPNLNESLGCMQSISGQWFEKYYCYALQQGIVEESQRPSDQVSLTQAANIMQRIYKSDLDFISVLSDKKSIPASVKTRHQSLTRGEFVDLLGRYSDKFPSFFQPFASIFTEQGRFTWIGTINSNYEGRIDFMRSRHYIYYQHEKDGLKSPIQKLSQADVNTFKVEENYLANDKNLSYSFFQGEKLISSIEKPIVNMPTDLHLNEPIPRYGGKGAKEPAGLVVKNGQLRCERNGIQKEIEEIKKQFPSSYSAENFINHGHGFSTQSGHIFDDTNTHAAILISPIAYDYKDKLFECGALIVYQLNNESWDEILYTTNVPYLENAATDLSFKNMGGNKHKDIMVRSSSSGTYYFWLNQLEENNTFKRIDRFYMNNPIYKEKNDTILSQYSLGAYTQYYNIYQWDDELNINRSKVLKVEYPGDYSAKFKEYNVVNNEDILISEEIVDPVPANYLKENYPEYHLYE